MQANTPKNQGASSVTSGFSGLCREGGRNPRRPRKIHFPSYFSVTKPELCSPKPKVIGKFLVCLRCSQSNSGVGMGVAKNRECMLPYFCPAPCGSCVVHPTCESFSIVQQPLRHQGINSLGPEPGALRAPRRLVVCLLLPLGPCPPPRDRRQILFPTVATPRAGWPAQRCLEISFSLVASANTRPLSGRTDTFGSPILLSRKQSEMQEKYFL